MLFEEAPTLGLIELEVLLLQSQADHPHTSLINYIYCFACQIHQNKKLPSTTSLSHVWFYADDSPTGCVSEITHHTDASADLTLRKQKRTRKVTPHVCKHQAKSPKNPSVVHLNTSQCLLGEHGGWTEASFNELLANRLVHDTSMQENKERRKTTPSTDSSDCCSLS